jgi:hypothetical protein
MAAPVFTPVVTIRHAMPGFLAAICCMDFGVL